MSSKLIGQLICEPDVTVEEIEEFIGFLIEPPSPYDYRIDDLERTVAIRIIISPVDEKKDD